MPKMSPPANAIEPCYSNYRLKEGEAVDVRDGDVAALKAEGWDFVDEELENFEIEDPKEKEGE